MEILQEKSSTIIMTFQLVSSCQGIVFLKGICISRIDHFVPFGCQYLTEVPKPTYVVTSSIAQSRSAIALLTALGYQDHLITSANNL